MPVDNLEYPGLRLTTLPGIEGAVLPVFREIGLPELGQQPLPRCVEDGAGRVFAAVARGQQLGRLVASSDFNGWCSRLVDA
jgi:hypothetical protein